MSGKYSYKDFEGALVAAFLTVLCTGLALMTNQQDVDEMYRAKHRWLAQILVDLGPLACGLIGGSITFALTLWGVAKVSTKSDAPQRTGMFQNH